MCLFVTVCRNVYFRVSVDMLWIARALHLNCRSFQQNVPSSFIVIHLRPRICLLVLKIISFRLRFYSLLNSRWFVSDINRHLVTSYNVNNISIQSIKLQFNIIYHSECIEIEGASELDIPIVRELNSHAIQTRNSFIEFVLCVLCW